MDPSLRKYLGGLSSEDVLRKADALRELQRHEGWAVVQELLDVQINWMRQQIESGQIHKVEDYAHNGGTVRGLRQVHQIVDRALEVADAVRAEVERV